MGEGLGFKDGEAVESEGAKVGWAVAGTIGECVGTGRSSLGVGDTVGIPQSFEKLSKESSVMYVASSQLS